jgi:methionyl-tRNA formyltransferase
VKVVFFGAGENVFSNRHFSALLQTDAEIAAVVDAPKTNWISTNEAAESACLPFPVWAEKRGIPVVREENPNTRDTVSLIRDLAPDLFIAVGYNRILKAELLSIPPSGAVNFHASLLPAYRGKHPLYWALKQGEPLAGLSVHLMDAGLDTGDIVYQIQAAVRKDDTVAGLYDRIMQESVRLMPRLVTDAKAGRLQGTPQEEFPWNPSYYSSIPGEESE